MSHQVPWNKIILETFIEEAMLTKDEEKIMRTRVAGWSRVEQSLEFGMSTQKIDRIISTLKKKYDMVQKVNPILPPRKFSAEELYMDTAVIPRKRKKRK